MSGKQDYVSNQNFGGAAPPPYVYPTGAPSGSNTYPPQGVNQYAPPPAQTATGNSGPRRGLLKRHLNLPTDPDEVREMFDDVPGAAALGESDLVLVIDDSTTMKTNGYWTIVRDVLKYIAPIITAFDEDGITMYMLNGNGPGKGQPEKGVAENGWENIVDSETVEKIFNENFPSGTTPIASRLLHIIIPYMVCYEQRLETKQPRPQPLNICVLTDGVADDTLAVTDAIIDTCEWLDRLKAPNNQIGIQFLQVANLEVAIATIDASGVSARQMKTQKAKAAKDLETTSLWLSSLDDNIAEIAAKRGITTTRDMIDTKNAEQIEGEGGFDPEALIAIIAGPLVPSCDEKF